MATATTISIPSPSPNQPCSAVSTNEATTTHSDISAPTDTSNAFTINALH